VEGSRREGALCVLLGALAGLLAPVVLNGLGLMLDPGGRRGPGPGSAPLVFASLYLAPPGGAVGALLGAYLAHRARRDRDGG
jgi:hypothetical protein